MKRFVVFLVLALVTYPFGGTLADMPGLAYLEHRWHFNNGNLDDDPVAMGANKGPCTLVGNASYATFYADYVYLNNIGGGGTYDQTQNVCIGLPSHIILDSPYSAKTIQLWVADDLADRWDAGLFYLGDGQDGEWGGHPMLKATSRINEKTTVSWFQSQMIPGTGGGYAQRQFAPNVLGDGKHQLVIVTAADNKWVKIYYDGVYKTGWTGVPWEGPGLDQGHNFNDSYNRLGAFFNRPNDARWLTGRIYDFRIWGCNLTEAEIATLYSLGSEDGICARFLIFPIKGVSPNDANISSVFDHNSIGNNVPHPGIGVRAFTGETGTIKDPNWSTDNGHGLLYGYKKASGGSFKVNGHYTGGGTPTTLYYEGHTGYDFPYPHTYEVVAAAAGTLHKVNDSYNTIYIDHGTYSTWYLHMLTADTAALTDGASVTQGQHLGYCGDQGATGNVHLHFTVKKGTLQVDPYGWSGSGEDPYHIRFPEVHNEFLWIAPSPMTPATPPNPNVGQRPTGLSGQLNYWDVAQNQWVPMTTIPSTSFFNPSRPTIVITHGWRDRISNIPDWLGSDNWTMRMAKQAEAIANQNVNVLAWDWHANANPAGDAWFGTLVQNLFTNVQMIKDAAECAGRGNTEGGSLAWELKMIGINPAQTQLIGHSNGGAVMGSAATAISKLMMGQKIQRLTTLDSPKITMLSIPVNATQYILHDYANEVEVYFSGDRLDLAFGARVSGSNVFNGEVYPTGSPLNPEHSVIPDWYTNLGEMATIPHAPAPNVRGMNWSIISPNQPTTWIAEDCNEQGANTGIFGTTSFAEQVAAKRTTVKQMNFYSGEEYQGLHAAIINDAVRSYVANLWGNSDGYLFKTITIPAEATVMTFDMKVVSVVSGDYITLCFGDKVLFCEDITSVDSNFVTTLPIPIPNLAGQTDTLLFTLHHDTDTPGSSVLLDNITFSVYTSPRPMTVDLNHDGIPNLQDFSILANFWQTSCTAPDWCEGSDFDRNGVVDMNDLLIFAEFWLWPVADVNMDHAVNLPDYAVFANHWLEDTCGDPYWCGGTDFDHSGSVDLLDLAALAEAWLVSYGE